LLIQFINFFYFRYRDITCLHEYLYTRVFLRILLHIVHFFLQENRKDNDLSHVARKKFSFKLEDYQNWTKVDKAILIRKYIFASFILSTSMYIAITVTRDKKWE